MAIPNLLTGSILSIIAHALRCWALKLELELQDRLEKRMEEIDAKQVKLMEELQELRKRGRDHDADRLLYEAISRAGLRTSCADWLSVLGSRKTDSDARPQDLPAAAEREVGKPGSPAGQG